MKLKANITRRNVRRKLKDGTSVVLPRYILHFTDPLTGGRAQRNFESRKEAEEARNKLVSDISQGSYCDDRNAPTVEQAVLHWLKNRQGVIRPHTLTQYQLLADYIIGPVLKGSSGDRMRYTLHKTVGPGCELIPMLGPVKLNELTTAKIRERFNALADATSPGMARRALQSLGYALALAEEDYNIRTAKLPRNFGSRRQKPKKRILTLEQTRHLLQETRKDEKWGLYVAWPFYTGTRIGEQLAIMWEDIDFTSGQIHIHRSQNRNGTIEDVTKTEAGNRIIPLCQELREWLLEWKLRCPRKNGELHRIFPAQGFTAARPFPRLIHAGGPLLIANYRNRIWVPSFRRMELPLITPHAARHMVISALQAQGVEVGLVSKLVGHANPSVTIQHYTHAVRNAGNVMEKLVDAYHGN